MSLDRVRTWMDAERVGAAVLTNPVSIAYLTGFETNPHERLMALVLRGSDVVLVVPGLEEDSAAATARGASVRAWRDGDDPWAPVAAALDGTPGRVAVEKGHLSLAGWERLCALAGGPEAVDAGMELRRLRARKTVDEVRRLERAARLTDEVTERALAELRAGRSELDVAAAIDQHIAAGGGRPSFETIVQSGPNSAQPHLRPGGRRLAAGDLVLLDFGAACEGYRADTTRMAVVGATPDARQAEVHALILAAHDAAVAAVRPGARVGDVDEAARAVIRAGGLADRFIHRVGHGLGLEAHEDPSLDPGGATVLEEGMVVTIEPGVYLQGWGGVRIEDDVVVEARGRRLLTQADRALRRAG